MKCYAGIGSRETPAVILYLMTLLARKLEKSGYVLRSGGAGGADSAFEAGVTSPDMKEIYLPWPGFEGRNSKFQSPTTFAMTMAAKFHPKWEACKQGARKLHARNCHQILGFTLTVPVEFVMCWTRDGKDTGGTGQAMRIAMANDINIRNLKLKADLIMALDWLGISYVIYNPPHKVDERWVSDGSKQTREFIGDKWYKCPACGETGEYETENGPVGCNLCNSRLLPFVNDCGKVEYADWDDVIIRTEAGLRLIKNSEE